MTRAFAQRMQRALAIRDVLPRGQLKFLPRLSPGAKVWAVWEPEAVHVLGGARR